MFLKGITSVDIGLKAGITRERVRQRLHRYFCNHPEAYPLGHREQETAKILNVSPSKLAVLRKAGKSTILRLGQSYIYSEKSIKKLQHILAKHCRTCGKLIPPGKYSYCEVCRVQEHRDKYASMSEEAKNRHIAFSM